MPVNADLGADEVSVAKDILSGDTREGGIFVADASRKGFRDTGRGGGSRGELCPEEKPGDTARFRKGLFEERLRARPEEREPKAQTR